MLNESDRLGKEFCTKPKHEALLGTLDFMRSYLMPSHIQLWTTVAPLLQRKVFTAAIHYCRVNLTADWMWLHELTKSNMTASTGLWSKLWNGASLCQQWDNSPFFFSKSVSAFGDKPNWNHRQTDSDATCVKMNHVECFMLCLFLWIQLIYCSVHMKEEKSCVPIKSNKYGMSNDVYYSHNALLMASL